MLSAEDGPGLGQVGSEWAGALEKTLERPAVCWLPGWGSSLSAGHPGMICSWTGPTAPSLAGSTRGLVGGSGSSVISSDHFFRPLIRIQCPSCCPQDFYILWPQTHQRL